MLMRSLPAGHLEPEKPLGIETRWKPPTRSRSQGVREAKLKEQQEALERADG